MGSIWCTSLVLVVAVVLALGVMVCWFCLGGAPPDTGAGAAGPAGASAAGAGIGAAGGAVGILRQPSYTRRILNQGRFKHQTHFTPDALYTKNILHHACFTQNTVFYARQFLRQHLSHQTPFTPNAFYSKNPSHQAHLTRFTPGAFYIKRILHQRHVTNAY